MIKLIGAILVISACTALGIKHVLKKRESLSALIQLRNLITEIARAIGFQPEPLPDILRKIKKQVQQEESTFLNDLIQNIDTDPSGRMSILWQNALDSFAQEKDLPPEAKKIVAMLGDALGKSDLSTELHRLSQTSDSLTSLYEELEENRDKTEKMVKSLGILLGICIVILLV